MFRIFGGLRSQNNNEILEIGKIIALELKEFPSIKEIKDGVLVSVILKEKRLSKYFSIELHPDAREKAIAWRREKELEYGYTQIESSVTQSESE